MRRSYKMTSQTLSCLGTNRWAPLLLASLTTQHQRAAAIEQLAEEVPCLWGENPTPYFSRGGAMGDSSVNQTNEDLFASITVSSHCIFSTKTRWHQFGDNETLAWTIPTPQISTGYKPLGGVRLTPFLRHHCTGKIPKESAWHSIESLLGSGLRSSIVTWKKWLLKT